MGREGYIGTNNIVYSTWMSTFFCEGEYYVLGMLYNKKDSSQRYCDGGGADFHHGVYGDVGGNVIDVIGQHTDGRESS